MKFKYQWNLVLYNHNKKEIYIIYLTNKTKNKLIVKKINNNSVKTMISFKFHLKSNNNAT